MNFTAHWRASRNIKHEGEAESERAWTIGYIIVLAIGAVAIGIHAAGDPQ